MSFYLVGIYHRCGVLIPPDTSLVLCMTSTLNGLLWVYSKYVWYMVYRFSTVLMGPPLSGAEPEQIVYASADCLSARMMIRLNTMRIIGTSYRRERKGYQSPFIGRRTISNLFRIKNSSRSSRRVRCNPPITWIRDWHESLWRTRDLEDQGASSSGS